jgi:hypothetical protein
VQNLPEPRSPRTSASPSNRIGSKEQDVSVRRGSDPKNSKSANNCPKKAPELTFSRRNRDQLTIPMNNRGISADTIYFRKEKSVQKVKPQESSRNHKNTPVLVITESSGTSQDRREAEVQDSYQYKAKDSKKAPKAPQKGLHDKKQQKNQRNCDNSPFPGEAVTNRSS